jgi:hypothetical protein
LPGLRGDYPATFQTRRPTRQGRGFPKGEAAGSIAYPKAVTSYPEGGQPLEESGLEPQGAASSNLIKVDSKYIDNFCNFLRRGSDYKGEVA